MTNLTRTNRQITETLREVLGEKVVNYQYTYTDGENPQKVSFDSYTDDRVSISGSLNSDGFMNVQGDRLQTPQCADILQGILKTAFDILGGKIKLENVSVDEAGNAEFRREDKVLK